MGKGTRVENLVYRGIAMLWAMEACDGLELRKEIDKFWNILMRINKA